MNGVIERIAGTELTDPPYGTPSGTLRETAANLVTDLLPDYTVQQYKDGIAYFQEDVAAPLGITTVFDPLMYTGRQRRPGRRGHGRRRRAAPCACAARSR